jgi:hypothetical protein
MFKKKFSNDMEWMREVLVAFRGGMIGISMESTYNWYWVVDGLMEDGYKVHLSNPSAIQQYVGWMPLNLIHPWRSAFDSRLLLSWLNETPGDIPPATCPPVAIDLLPTCCHRQPVAIDLISLKA